MIGNVGDFEVNDHVGGWRDTIENYMVWSMKPFLQDDMMALNESESDEVDSEDEDDDDAGLPIGLRQNCPRVYAWMMARLGTPSLLVAAVALGFFEALECIVQEELWTDRDFEDLSRRQNATEVLQNLMEAQDAPNVMAVFVFINGISLIFSIFVTVFLEGASGLKKTLDLNALWRLLVPAICFQTAQHLINDALVVGVPPILVKTIGYVYMPVAAVISYVVFRRAYQSLEWMALTIVMLATMCFIFLREKCRAGSCTVFNVPYELNVGLGLLSLFLAVFISCVGSILAERIFKDMSLGLRRVHHGELHDRYYIHKVLLDFCGLMICLAVWCCPVKIQSQIWGIPRSYTWFGGGGLQNWSSKCWLYIFVNVGQWWFCGLVAKRLDTVAKALIQTVSTVFVLLLEDRLLDKFEFHRRWVPSWCMFLIVALAGIIFQTGRLNIRYIAQMTGQGSKKLNHAIALSVSNVVGGVHDLIFGDPTKELDEQSEEDDERNSGALAFCAKWSLPIIYICLDVLRIEVFSISIGDSMVTPQGFTILLNLALLLLSSMTVLMNPPLDGVGGGCAQFKEAWQPRKLLMYMPAGFFFGLATCMQSCGFAPGGVSGSIANVIGKIYLPVSALASRFILNKFYMWLEWFAIAILFLDCVAFGLLKMMGAGTGGVDTPLSSILFFAGSGTASALGSLVMQKTMVDEMSNGKPWNMQKLRCDVSSVFWSMVFLPILGLLASKDSYAKGAYWLYRPLTTECYGAGACGYWSGSSFVVDADYGDFEYGSWSSAGFAVNGTAKIGGECLCGKGIFVALDKNMWIPVCLLLMVMFGYIVGLIVAKFGTVWRAIFDNISFVLIYFVGDPIVAGTNMSDHALTLVALIIPVSTFLFNESASALEKVQQAREKAEELRSPKANTAEEEEEASDWEVVG
mmetsp:Transcript_79142/g.219987  ORF Transcript_79142/g.219987 Transcript_79142/m.219987 type:complete len:915 (-) Transcript_79142:161-2905(-)